jgi:hypothetical protein
MIKTKQAPVMYGYRLRENNEWEDTKLRPQGIEKKPILARWPL